MRLTCGLGDLAKETGLPLLRFSFDGFISLPLLKVLLELICIVEPLLLDGLGHVLPEAARLVGQLFFGWWTDFGNRHERRNIKKELSSVFILLVAFVALRRSRRGPVVNLFVPATFDPYQYVFVRNVFDLIALVVVWVVLEYNAFDLVLSPSYPAVLVISQDRLQTCFRTCDKTRVSD